MLVNQFSSRTYTPHEGFLKKWIFSIQNLLRTQSPENTYQLSLIQSRFCFFNSPGCIPYETETKAFTEKLKKTKTHDTQQKNNKSWRPIFFSAKIQFISLHLDEFLTQKNRTHPTGSFHIIIPLHFWRIFSINWPCKSPSIITKWHVSRQAHINESGFSLCRFQLIAWLIK